MRKQLSELAAFPWDDPERHELPMVLCTLNLLGGARHEPRDRMGLAEIAAGLMTRGAGPHDALQLRRHVQRHAIGISTGCGSDFAAADLSVFRSKLDLGLDLLADVVLRPRFDAAELERSKHEMLVGLEQHLANPGASVGWFMSGLMYGRGHAYARASGGMRSTVPRIGRADLLAFHRAAFDPRGASITLVGDTTMEEMLPKLEARFGDWRPDPASVPPRAVGKAVPTAPGVYFIDRPGAQQSTIAAALLMPAASAVDAPALEVIDRILGGDFSSRLNMNLREAKQWTYGSRTEMSGTLQERVYATVAPVQTDRTADSMREILREYRDIVGARPITPEEVSRIQRNHLLSMPSMCETLGQLRGTLVGLQRRGLPDDHWTRYGEHMATLTPEQVNTEARRLIDPARLVWVLVGDRARVEAEVRALELGTFQLLEVADEALYL